MKKSAVIAVDGAPFFRPLDGIGRYSSTLLNTLAAKDRSVKYHVIGFFDDKYKPHLTAANNNISFVYLPVPRRVYQFIFKYIKPLPVNKLLNFKPNAVLYFNFVRTPFIKNCPAISFVHDLAFLDQPAFVEAKNQRYLAKFVPQTIAKSQRVVAISNYTKKRILSIFEDRPDTIQVVSNAVDEHFFAKISQKKLTQVKRTYKLPKNFILFVGTLEPRKNIDTILKAYQLLEDVTKQTHPLVFAGAKGWNISSKTKLKIEKMQKNNELLLLGRVKEKDLAALYKLSKLLVFPSNYEGFGLPVLESMAAGTPVVTSDIPTIKTVTGSAALTSHPQDALAISKNIEKLINNSTLRQSIIEQGIKQAKKFTWQKSADQLYKII